MILSVGGFYAIALISCTILDQIPSFRKYKIRPEDEVMLLQDIWGKVNKTNYDLREYAMMVFRLNCPYLYN